MAALKVPREYQQEALMVGIILALIFRGIFIALGYQLINNFSWVFYIFGAFLVYTAVTLVKSYRSHEEEHPEDNKVVQFAQRHLNVGERYDGLKLWYRENGVRVVSPMLIVIIALGTTDLLFALDSIPAIFGITQEPYLVFTANVFALMGLRPALLPARRAAASAWSTCRSASPSSWPSSGSSWSCTRCTRTSWRFLNGGEHVDVPDISSLFSLGVIIVTLACSPPVLSLAEGQEGPRERPGRRLIVPE